MSFYQRLASSNYDPMLNEPDPNEEEKEQSFFGSLGYGRGTITKGDFLVREGLFGLTNNAEEDINSTGEKFTYDVVENVTPQTGLSPETKSTNYIWNNATDEDILNQSWRDILNHHPDFAGKPMLAALNELRARRNEIEENKKNNTIAQNEFENPSIANENNIIAFAQENGINDLNLAKEMFHKQVIGNIDERPILVDYEGEMEESKTKLTQEDYDEAALLKAQLTVDQSIENSNANAARRLEQLLPQAGMAMTGFLTKYAGKNVLPKSIITDLAVWNHELEKETLLSPTFGLQETLIKGKKDAEGKSAKLPAIYGAALNVATTVGPTMLAAAMRMPMLGKGILGVQIGLPMVAEYNKQQAEAKGMAIEDYLEEGNINLTTPVAIAYPAYALEKLGYKGMTNALLKAAGKSAASKKLVGVLSSMGTEAWTEWLQTGLETFNSAKGANATDLEASKIAADSMFSDEGIEAAMQGAVGSGVVVGVGGVGKRVLKALSNLRAGVDTEGIESDIEEIENLRIEKLNSSDKTVQDGIELQIQNVKNRLENRITKSNGLVASMTTEQIDEINNMADLAALQQKRVLDLKKKLDSNEITEDQFNSAYDGFKASFIEAKNRIKGIASEAESNQKSVEGVSETTVANANAINEAYENNPGSVDVFNNVVLPNTEALVNKVANSLFREYGEFKEGANTRADFITNLKFGTPKNPASSLKGLYESFRPEEGQYLSTYLQNNLRNRGKRILDEMVNQQVTEGAASIEAPQVQELTSDERADLSTADSQIEVGKKIGVKLDNEKVKDIIVKHYNPDSKKFKKEISDDFKIAFKNPIDNFFGKDTKTKNPFTQVITKNAKALYDVLTPEGMRMARGVDGVNPFIQAGMLVEKDGKFEKAAFENTKLNTLLNYLKELPGITEQSTKAEIEKATRTRSNRQARFKEAVSVSIASSQAINLLNNDVDLRRRYLDLNKLGEEIANNLGKPSKEQEAYLEIASPKINSGNIHKLLGFDQITIDSNADIKAKQKQMLDFIKKYKIPSWVLELSQLQNFGALRTATKKDSPESRKLKAYLEKNNIKAKPEDYYYALEDGTWVPAIKQTTKKGKVSYKLPIEFVDQILPKKGGLYNGKQSTAWSDALAAAKENDKFYPTPNVKRVKIPKKIEGNQEATKKYLKENQEQFQINQEASDLIVNILDNAVNKEGAPIELAALYITSALQATSGWIKISAPITHIVDKFEYGTVGQFAKGIKTVEEHTPPANVAGLTLIAMIHFNQVKQLKPKWNKNFFQVLQSKKNDQALAQNKLTKSLPEGVGMLDDNAGVKRMSAANLDLNKISNVTTNKTVAEEMGVEGPSTPDAVKAANESITEDKFEFLIDRLIAKLNELTGSKGLAVDPFLLLAVKDVSLNVLIGGLRAVKATYRLTKNISKAIDAGYENVKRYMSKAEWLEFAKTATKQTEDVNTPGKAKFFVYSDKAVAKAQEKVRLASEKLLRDLGIDTSDLDTFDINEKLNILRKAKSEALNKNAPTKKARVFDFDDTLAKTNSNVLYTLPDGTEGSLTATEFADQAESLEAQGATFDFSEFSQVKDGSKGPLAVLAKKMAEAKGDRDIFVLTARPASSAKAIQSFLRAVLGISVPLENITGLGNGTPGAKAFWVAEKVSKGYNDVFFADDAPQNVNAVNKMLTMLGVKGKTQQAKESDSKSLEDETDSILRSKKPTIGSIFRKFNIYVPPGADDFVGLLYTFLGKGKIGEAQLKFFKDNLMTPFAKGIAAYEAAKVALGRDYRALKKNFKNKKVLKERVVDGIYTKEQAVRAYLYNKAGYDLGLNKADAAELIAIVEGDASLKAFADQLAIITKIPEGYPEITPDWLGGNIETDLANVSNKSQRKMFLEEFIKNKNQIFSEQNLKLIKQLHGNDFTDALLNVLERMETGVNRKKGKDKEFNIAMDWINASVANVMSVNIRSAVLQQLSILNFMNWSFNNPLKMGKAMANIPQFKKDFLDLINSPFLVERRGGMKIEINTADLANSNPGNFFLRTHKKMLELGFKPTQWADSFAIAFGGASWYRNRVEQLKSEGVSDKEARAKAMLEFQEIAEESQQSSRPDKVSRQQASEIGRFILAFANTPLQYARLTKKATLDLINGRGDWRTNASKILYYGAAQNIIFSAIQSGLFSLLLSDDEDDEKEEKKIGYFANGILDGFLRGMGYSGAAIAALKNLSMEWYRQNQAREEGKRVYNASTKMIQSGLSISPPLSKKIGDIIEADKFQTWRQYKDDPFYQGFAAANYVSALTNVPLDRAFKKIENLKAINLDRNEAWQNVFLSLGWSPYQLNVETQSGKIPSKTSKGPKMITPPLKKIKHAKLPGGAIGRANKDGTIEISPDLKGQERKEVIAHEKQHMKDLKAGILNYDDKFVYWKKNKYPRVGNQINYKGKFLPEGHIKLPWEARANKAEKTNS